MIHDKLLAYLSEKGRGTWAELRDAWDWLAPADDPALRASIVAQELSALGHIEVSWKPKGIEWCAAPPVITMLPRSGGRSLVTGGRTRYLYARSGEGAAGESGQRSGALVDAVNELELWLDPFRHARAPTTLMVAVESHRDAEALAERLGIRFNYSVAYQLALVLPPLSQYAKLWPRGELPRGFDVERFDPHRLHWSPTDDPTPHGLYRAKTFSEYVHVLHGPVGWLSVSRDHAVYEVLRWAENPVIRYDSRTLELAVPYHAPLPGLHARAAVLSSGMLPDAEHWKEGNRPIYCRVYANVDPTVARLIASSLSQDLKVKP